MSSPSLTQQQLAPLFDDLAQQGLVLATAVAVQQLPDNIWLDTAAARKNHGTLLLLGHGGRVFWECYQQTVPAAIDLVDTFSATASNQALQQHLPKVQRECLFPADDCPVNLMALGRAVGWHAPSPLGMGIHANYGLWSAYRALWWLDAELESAVIPAVVPVNATVSSLLPVAHDLCSQCTTQDCLPACPAEALSRDAAPDLQRCADFRLAADSACAETCLARMACPVAPEHRYQPEQMAYHYDLARSQIHFFSSQSSKKTLRK